MGGDFEEIKKIKQPKIRYKSVIISSILGILFIINYIFNVINIPIVDLMLGIVIACFIFSAFYKQIYKFFDRKLKSKEKIEEMKLKIKKEEEKTKQKAIKANLEIERIKNETELKKFLATQETIRENNKDKHDSTLKQDELDSNGCRIYHMRRNSGD